MIPLNERRGLNRQQAAAYLGIKESYFDKVIRPKLIGIRMGTSVIFDRHELDYLFETMHNNSVNTIEEVDHNPHGSPGQKENAVTGKPTKVNGDLDFWDISKKLRKNKSRQ